MLHTICICQKLTCTCPDHEKTGKIYKHVTNALLNLGLSCAPLLNNKKDRHAKEELRYEVLK